MQYKQVLNYIYGLEKFGIKLGLDNITALLNLLDNPQNSYKTIHIAGTNGKGSVTAMCASILQEAGYEVGRYTSPHVVNFRERIQVNGREISRKEVVEYFLKIKNYSDKLAKKGIQVTYFEFLTAMAFLYFKDKKVDFAIIEVGLGGRLDATNVINPLVSIITNIGLEHTEYLGNNIIQIAKEKAGIIKESSVLVTADSDKNIEKLFRKICAKKKTRFISITDQYKYSNYSSKLSCQRFRVKGKFDKYNIKIKLLGKHQVTNSMTTMAAIEALRNYGIGIKRNQIINGLRKTIWFGRLEIMQKKPLTIIDCAHNPHGMKTLVDFIRELKPKRLVLVLGIASDKNIKEMIRLIVPLVDKLIITKAKYRGADTRILKKIAEKYVKNIVIIDDVVKAVKKALNTAKKDDMILITGSIYMVSEARKVWFKVED